MAHKKRKVDEVIDLPESVLLKRIQDMPEPYRSYACFCYLFGNRVSEGLGIPKRDKIGHYEYERVGRKKKVYTIQVPKFIETPEKGYELNPIEKRQIEYDKKNNVLWVLSIKTLKKADRPPRNVEVIIDGYGEAPFIETLMRYIENKKDKEFLWTFNRKQAYYMFMKYLDVMPHKLRSMRATKDVKIYAADAKDLMDKYKWSNANVALHYIQKNPQDRIDKARRKTQELLGQS